MLNDATGESMARPKLAVLVRFTTPLPIDDVMAIAEGRMGEFRAQPGLVQKYYLQEPASGDVCGLYFWESPEAFDAFRRSELRASIAAAYQAQGEPRVEVFQIRGILREA
jgi:heme-degrading monooxygenase HmoA